MTTFRTAHCLSLLFTAAALVCGNAALAGDQDPRQRIVKYGDLELDSTAGIQVLYRRLSNAAKEVCAPSVSVPLTLRSKARECANQALADAVARMNHPNLNAYHAAKTGFAKDGETKVASRR